MVFVGANRFPCVPACFSYPLSDKGKVTYKHCYDKTQDEVMCELASTFNVADALSSTYQSIYKTTVRTSPI